MLGMLGLIVPGIFTALAIVLAIIMVIVGKRKKIKFLEKKVVIENVVTLAQFWMQGIGYFLSSIGQKELGMIFYFAFLIILLRSIWVILASPNKVTREKWLYLLLDFLMSILIVFMLLTSLDDEIIRNVSIAIASSLLGGGFTLVGVAITIKDSNASSRDGRQRVTRPFIYPLEAQRLMMEGRTIILRIFDSSTSQGETVEIGVIGNSNKNSFLLKWVKLADYVYLCHSNQVVEEKESFSMKIHLNARLKEPIQNVLLCAEDMDGNDVIYKLGLKQKSDEYYQVLRCDYQMTSEK